MRSLVTTLALSCFAVLGYADDSMEVAVETTTEITKDDTTSDVGVNENSNTTKKDCGCGSGKGK